MRKAECARLCRVTPHLTYYMYYHPETLSIYFQSCRRDRGSCAEGEAEASLKFSPSAFADLPGNRTISSPPVWGLQGGLSHAGCGSQQRLQRDTVSLCGMPYYDHAHNLQKSSLQTKY